LIQVGGGLESVISHVILVTGFRYLCIVGL